ncbi:hypothetical protein BASA81_010045 [Batrachochytrium salamandrivorans]|nr:hypothetical protein BASA81_010045 [Batrachochytrium salamandrivorans]
MRRRPSQRWRVGYLFIALTVVVMLSLPLLNQSIAPTLLLKTTGPTTRPTTRPTVQPTTIATTLSPTQLSPKTPIYYTLDFPVGRFCNQLLALSTAMERVKKIPQAVLVLGDAWSYLRNLLDIETMAKWMGGSHKLVFKDRHGYNAGYVVTSSWWDRACAERVVRDSIVSGLVPWPEIQTLAQNKIAALKQRGANSTLAVHVRSFEGECNQRTQDPAKYGSFCHIDATQLNGKLNQCLFQPKAAAFLQELRNEFPTVDLSSSAAIGLFLSSDGLSPFVDAEFAQAFPNVERASAGVETAMLVDMWTSSLADVYVANTMSSCESIVAQWRAKHGKPNTQYPRACFDGYSAPPDLVARCGPGATWDDYNNKKQV